MPSCGDEGSVPQATVIEVLKSSGVSVREEEEGRVILVIHEIPEVLIFSENVPRRMIHYISRKYGVQIQYFYHPDMMRKL